MDLSHRNRQRSTLLWPQSRQTKQCWPCVPTVGKVWGHQSNSKATIACQWVKIVLILDPMSFETTTDHCNTSRHQCNRSKLCLCLCHQTAAPNGHDQLGLRYDRTTVELRHPVGRVRLVLYMSCQCTMHHRDTVHLHIYHGRGNLLRIC